MKKLIVPIVYGGFGAMYARRKLGLVIASLFGREAIFYICDSHPYLPIFGRDCVTLPEGKIFEFNFFQTDNEYEIFNFDKYWHSDLRNIYQTYRPTGIDYSKYSGELYHDLFMSCGDDVLDTIESMRTKAGGFGLPVIHFRRGDKITESPYLDDAYVFSLVSQLNLGNDFFLASDDIDYIHYIIGKYPSLSFCYDKHEYRFNNSRVSNAQAVSQGGISGDEETFTFMKNISIFSRAPAVIGASNVQLTKIGGSINNHLSCGSNLYLMNTFNNSLSVMGDSSDSS